MNPKATTTLMLTLAALFLGSAKAETGRSLLVVLDASGSMNAKLPDGAARIDAAKAAVADLISGLPADTRLALRIYGHQSPTSKKDCQDTALVVSFGPAGENGGAVTVAANAAQAAAVTTTKASPPWRTSTASGAAIKGRTTCRAGRWVATFIGRASPAACGRVLRVPRRRGRAR